MLNSDRTKQYLAVEPNIPPLISQDTWVQVQFGLAIGILPILLGIGWWALTNHFLSKNQHSEKLEFIQFEINRRIDELNEKTDSRIDKINIDLVKVQNNFDLVIIKIESYLIVSAEREDRLIQEFNRLRAENAAFQNSLCELINDLSKEVKITNRGLETMHSRLDRLKYEDKEDHK